MANNTQDNKEVEINFVIPNWRDMEAQKKWWAGVQR